MASNKNWHQAANLDLTPGCITLQRQFVDRIELHVHMFVLWIDSRSLKIVTQTKKYM